MSHLQRLKKVKEMDMKAVKVLGFKPDFFDGIKKYALTKKERGFFYYIYHYTPSTRRYNTDKGRPWLRPKFNKLK